MGDGEEAESRKKPSESCNAQPESRNHSQMNIPNKRLPLTNNPSHNSQKQYTKNTCRINANMLR